MCSDAVLTTTGGDVYETLEATVSTELAGCGHGLSASGNHSGKVSDSFADWVTFGRHRKKDEPREKRRITDTLSNKLRGEARLKGGWCYGLMEERQHRLSSACRSQLNTSPGLRSRDYQRAKGANKATASHAALTIARVAVCAKVQRYIDNALYRRIGASCSTQYNSLRVMLQTFQDLL